MEYDDFLNTIYITEISKTYELFETSQRTRQILSETWAMKLRGYKKYFRAPVLPNDQLDFMCNHIVINDKTLNRPVAAIKNVTLKQCNEFNLRFPIFDHLFKGNEAKYEIHMKSITEWLKSKRPEDVAYSMGFTIEPSLERNYKKFLCNAIFHLFYYYYTTNCVGNIIHGLSRTFKLSQNQAHMGSEILKNSTGETLGPVLTEYYDDVESDIVIIEKFSDEFIEEALYLKSTWENREILRPTANNETAAA